MRASWEALHAGLDRSVRTLQAEQSFQQAKAQHPVLAGFDDETTYKVLRGNAITMLELDRT